MARTNKILALLAMSSMLPAAAVAQGRNWNPSLDSVNQRWCKRTDFAFDVDASGGGLSDRELHRLRQWFASLQLGYGDEINVDAGAYDNVRARQDIAAVAGDYGLLLGQSAPIPQARFNPVPFVSWSAAEAFVPGCPNCKRPMRSATA
jgi:pilus assembly protein CpaD